MKFHSADKIHLSIPKAALAAVFDECDGFDQDETGGRVIGTFDERKGKLDIHVTGIIEAGPQARRSAVSFFQDGEYQEQVFRKIENHHRHIEHLGNWHTHHVNGLDRLSNGDIETYYRTVNHRNHNTSFFYALLVTTKHRSSELLRRYAVKHYIFRRDDERIYELHRDQVEIVRSIDEAFWPAGAGNSQDKRENHPRQELGTNPNRAHDNDILSEFFRGVRPFSNPKLGVYSRRPARTSGRQSRRDCLASGFGGSRFDVYRHFARASRCPQGLGGRNRQRRVSLGPPPGIDHHRAKL